MGLGLEVLRGDCNPGLGDSGQSLRGGRLDAENDILAARLEIDHAQIGILA